ncbi:Glyoxalase-like domain-containing protein [Fusarium oxysporum f. sp. albedinis]|nr:Glyoxalase-like domain-containing protein [Fusarium oxysporum f. sp. albedinis]
MFPPNDEVELHTVKPSARPYSRKSLVASQTQECSALIQQTSWKHGNPRQSEPHSESQGYEKYSASYSRLQRSSVSPNGCHERAEPTLEATPSLTELLKEKLCFRSLHKKENPKKVCSNNRLSALGHFSLFHLPAITITLLLLVLYVRHFRWTPPHPTGDELSVLQFAAKAHETLILISLSDIMLHRILYGLLMDDGIPLGFLPSVFSLGSPIQYLLSWDFWSALLNPTANRRFHGLTGVMIVFILLLSIMASPFSATAMIPRQGWWDADNDFFGDSASRDTLPVYYISGNPAKLKLDSRDVFQGDNTFCDPEVSNVTCWEPTLDTIVQTLLPVFRDAPMIPLQENITYSVNSIGRKNRPISLSNAAEHAEIALTTYPMTFVADAFSREYSLTGGWINGYNNMLIKSKQKHSSGTRKWKQPLVAVHCNETWVTGKTATFNFDTGFLDNTTLELDLESDSRLKNMAEDTDLGVQDAMFLDLENKIIRHSVSAAILFANRVRKDGIQEKRDTNGETILGLGLCLVSARWVDAEVWVIRQNSVVVNSNLGFTSEDFLTYLHETSTAKDVIKMSDGWLKGVGPLLNGTQESPSTSIYKGASVFCSHNAIGFFSGCLANALAVHLTDALAQPTRLRAWYDDGSGDPLPDEQDTIIQSTHYKYTYAYELKGSIAIPLALAVLLLHVCTALVHVGTILLSPRPWHGSSWRSFGQMLVLALRSRVDGLDNVGGGVSSPQTWKRTTMVRDVGEGRLEMIVNVDEGEVQGDGGEFLGGQKFRRVQAGKEYN